MTNLPLLKNKTIIVTGGAGVLGSAFSLEVAKNGANTVVIGRNEEKAKAFVDQLKSQGYEALAIACDVTNKKELENAAKLIMDTYGSIDALINNAGGNHPSATTENRFASESDGLIRDFFKMDEAAINNLFELNFIGTLLPTQVFARYMKKENHPSIINISSMSAFKPLTKIPAYSASKAAINNLTQWLAVHFASAGIRVNAIAPGFFISEQNKQLLFNEDGTKTKRAESIIEHTPMQRFGHSNELLGTLMYLLNHETSGFVTGIIIPVDGGFSAFGGI
jgi:NAD(P)-dependent dehydrogenase (short-subunit alcohol dehydrogenase family)